MSERPVIPILMTHKHSRRTIHVKTTVTLLIVIAIISAHPFVALVANLIWVWADEE